MTTANDKAHSEVLEAAKTGPVTLEAVKSGAGPGGSGGAGDGEHQVSCMAASVEARRGRLRHLRPEGPRIRAGGAARACLKIGSN